MKFKGDRTAKFDPETNVGLLGKVLGPNTRREWFIVSKVTYDRATDTSTAEVQKLVDPELIFDNMVGDPS